jgi:hypothetical protein
MYPEGEVGGVRLDCLEPAAFRYTILAHEILIQERAARCCDSLFYSAVLSTPARVVGSFKSRRILPTGPFLMRPDEWNHPDGRWFCVKA